MGIINNFINGSGIMEINLAGASEGKRMTLKVDNRGKNMAVRVPKDELEATYIADPITFNSINKTVQMLMSSDYYIHSTQKRVIKFYEDFFKNIGVVGENLTMLELFEWLFKDLGVFGEGYIEIIYDETDKMPLDLTRVDPKKMDVARDGSGNAITDIYGKIIGYTMKVEGKVKGGDPVPEQYKRQVSLNSMIFLLPKRIVQFKLYPYADGFSGIGLIEPGYKSTKRKLAITEAQTNSIYTRGTYPIIATVGDPNHEPTQKDIDNTLNLVKDMKHDRYFAFPYWTKIQALEVKQSDIVENTLKFLREEQSASLGMPLAFATGAGEATNRATLNNQQEILQLTLLDIQKRFLSTFNKFVMTVIAKANGLPEVGVIRADKIGVEEKNDKSKRLIGYVEKGILTTQEVKQFAIKSEELQDREKVVSLDN
jgi:hypothetical protein